MADQNEETTKHNCFVTIDNTGNPYDLTLLSINTEEGTFSPALMPGQTTVAKNSTFQFSLNASDFFFGADGVLVWTTGPAAAVATITTTFMNELVLQNVASLNVSGSADALMAYGGVCYLEAGSGEPQPPLMRDFIPNGLLLPAYPLYVHFHIVRNAYADQPASFLPGIKNVVMLMLENRGFDHLLGQLYTSPPPVVYPENSSPDFDGLGAVPTFSNTDAVGNTVTAYPIPSAANLHAPDPDPEESWENINEQIFYPGTPDDKPTMGGFLQNYTQKDAADPNQVMGFYTWLDLPVISTLAAAYAVSDRWFCSVPAQTYTNRAFSLAGTASGLVNNEYLSTFKMRTMFNVLSDSGDNDWAIYYQDKWIVDTSFTSWKFSAIENDPMIDTSQRVQPFENFLEAAKSGTLSAFSYLEPAWFFSIFGNGNDYHPTANLAPGEAMLNKIYEALTSNAAAWADTLFIITFDEHGGTMDHVAPPHARRPDNIVSPEGFDFSRLGVRVPTLMISPRIPHGMVFRSPEKTDFDHTSFIKTILGWRGIDISGGAMGKRAAVAPDFSGIISDQLVNAAVQKITPNTAAEHTTAAYLQLPLNDLQKGMASMLAHGISNTKKGSDEHLRIWEEMKALGSLQELQDYIENKKTN